MTNAGYLEYDPTSGRFSLPPEHAPALAEEGGFSSSGVQQMLVGMTRPLDQLMEAFRQGGGVSQSAFEDVVCGAG